MKNGSMRKCLILALTGCMLLCGTVFAENAVEALEVTMPETEYEEPAAEIHGSIPEDIDTGEAAKEVPGPEVPDLGEPDTEVFIPEEFTVEELVGEPWKYYIELDRQYDFVCYNGSESNYFVYTAEESGTYCMDLTKTSGRVLGEVYYSEDAISFKKTDGWTGYYDASGFHINMNMEAGMKYAFYIRPDTNRADSGKFRLRRATKEITSFSVSVIGDRYLAVGYSTDGEWGTEKDGTTDYTRWEFNPARMLDMYSVTVTFADNTKYTWTYANDGFTVGSTYLRISAEQDLDGWTVGEPAYCNIQIGIFEEVTRVEIPYVYFTDVQDPSHAYYKAIYWAAGKGITRGYSDNTFGIDRACTRGEAVMFLWKVMGRPAPKAAAKSPFKDVETTHSFYKAILWASQKGITKGFSDGTFGINKTCTRGQIMTFIWRAKGQPAPKSVKKSPFSDVSTNHAYYKAILWGSQKGITKGFSDGTFGINRDCTRGQIVTFLYRS